MYQGISVSDEDMLGVIMLIPRDKCVDDIIATKNAVDSGETGFQGESLLGILQ